MNARERLAAMIRTNPGSMTVWSTVEASTALDAYRDEVLAEAAETLEARGYRLLGDMVRSIVTAGPEEKASASTAPTATPPALEARLAQLLDTIRTRLGKWSTGVVMEVRRSTGGPTQRGTARRDLAELHRRGHLTQHGAGDGRYYTLTRKNDRPRETETGVADGEIQFVGFPPLTLSRWTLTQLAPDYYGKTYMQIGGWLPKSHPAEHRPGGTAQMTYAHLHGHAIPRDLTVQVETKGYGTPGRFMKIQWRKDNA
ncbi:hypothetical protein [Streptomyces hebeiensis]